MSNGTRRRREGELSEWCASSRAGGVCGWSRWAAVALNKRSGPSRAPAVALASAPGRCGPLQRTGVCGAAPRRQGAKFSCKQQRAAFGPPRAVRGPVFAHALVLQLGLAAGRVDLSAGGHHWCQSATLWASYPKLLVSQPASEKLTDPSVRIDTTPGIPLGRLASCEAQRLQRATAAHKRRQSCANIAYAASVVAAFVTAVAKRTIVAKTTLPDAADTADTEAAQSNT